MIPLVHVVNPRHHPSYYYILTDVITEILAWDDTGGDLWKVFIDQLIELCGSRFQSSVGKQYLVWIIQVDLV